MPVLTGIIVILEEAKVQTKQHHSKNWLIGAAFMLALGATIYPATAQSATNQQLIDKYNSGQKLTAAEIQQLKNAGAYIRNAGRQDERLVFRRPESPAKDPQESAYRYWLRKIGGKVK